MNAKILYTLTSYGILIEDHHNQNTLFPNLYHNFTDINKEKTFNCVFLVSFSYIISFLSSFRKIHGVNIYTKGNIYT